MKTKNYFSKKLTYFIFGDKYYHNIKSKKILFDFIIGKDYDEINKYMSKIISSNDIILDIGANMGQYLSRFSKIIKNGKIVCIEPLPINVAALNSMKKYLDIKNVTIINKAISASIGKTNITIPRLKGIPITTQASLLDDDLTKGIEKEKIEVETTTIDEIVNSLKLPKVDFIKIDTEGFDSVVLNSGIDTIKKYKPLIRIEANCFKKETNWLFAIGYHAFKFKKYDLVSINNKEENMKISGDTFLATEEQLTKIVNIYSL